MKARLFIPLLVIIGFFAVCFVLTGSALAAVEELSLEELVSRAVLIVRGTVIDTNARWNPDHTRIYTLVTIRPTEGIKGSLQAGDLSIEIPGGTVGDVRLEVSDTPTFEEGEEVILFLQDEYFRVVGWNQGKYTIEKGTVVETNQPVETFASEIREIVRREEPSAEERNLALPAVVTLDPDLGPVSSEDRESKLDSTISPPFRQPAWELVKYEDFEGAFPNQWILSGDPTWGDDSYRPYMGSWSGWCANGGANAVWPPDPYPNDVDAAMGYGPFSLVGVDDADMFFYHWTKNELGFDFFFVGASIDGSNFYGTSYSGD